MTQNKKLYAETYTECFIKAYPELPAKQSKVLIEKAMLSALRDIRSVNIDGKAFKATSKELGIRHTYKAIEEFLNDESDIPSWAANGLQAAFGSK